MRLVEKVLLAFAVVGLLAFASVSLGVYLYSVSTLKGLVGGQKQAEAKYLMGEVDRLLYERYMDIQEVSSGEIKNKFEFGVENASDSANYITNRLVELKSVGGPWDMISVVGVDGEVLFSTSQQMVGRDVVNLSAFWKAVVDAAKGKTVYSDLVRLGEGEPTMLFVSPIKVESSDGVRIDAVVVGHYSWKVVDELMGQLDGSRAYLLSSESQLLASNVGGVDDQVLKENWAGLEYMEQVKMGKNTSFEETSGIGGDEVLVSVVDQSGYLDFYGKGWSLVMETPMEVIVDLSKGMALKLLGMMSASIFVMLVVLGVLVYRWVLVPIEKMNKASSKFAQGNFRERVDVRGNDELGILAGSFNQMAEKLAGVYESLESEVKKKTKELEDQVKAVQKKNEMLEETKKAMANLLDDARKLEEALKKEKEGVEQKVEDRTRELVEKTEELEQAQVEMEKAFQEAKSEAEKTKAIVQSIGDGVFVVDGERRIILANKVTERLSGYSADEMVGQVYNTCLKFVLEETGEENTSFIDQVFATGKMVSMANHTVLIRKDGTQVVVADSAAPLRDYNQNVVGCVVVFRDVSKEREIERMKDEFISIASHQLRTPLTALRWKSARLLREKTGELNQKQHELATEMRISVKRLIELVNALLNISRIESGRIMVEPQMTNLGDLMRSVVDEVKEKVEEKQQAIELESDDAVVNVSVDPKLIRQVYLNLMTNAIKYSEKGKRIGVRIFKEEEELVTEIADNGYGIPAKQQEKVFGRFFRAENILKTDNEGTGLGLYLVKKIVEASGGRIDFKSVEGQGTTFWVRLPVSGSQAKEGEVSLADD